VVCPDGPERKLAAILSADVVGYSRLMAEDEAGTIRTLTSYRKEIRGLVGDHRGRVVDATGDNLLAEFPTALDAVECAAEVQRVLAARNASLSHDHRMQFRIGIHLGDVSVEDDRIYGDGVNIAARLEGLAEPGSVCISGEVHGQVERKLDLGFEDLGEQTLKNLPKPIRVYRLSLSPSNPQSRVAHDLLPGMAELTVPGFGGAPAIAVLPFENLSGDPEQEYFADGIAEDLITRLSIWRRIPVIARNSSFVYKGKVVDVRKLSRELGVHYVVEGSVRKAAGKVRVSSQLIDATSGHHVWAERYDRQLQDVFALQDEITEAIVASIYRELGQFEQIRVVHKAPRNLDAWNLLQRAHWHFNRFNAADNSTARSLFEKAAELDPHWPPAFSGLSFARYFEVVNGWSESVETAITELQEAANKSITLDPSHAEGHLALGLAYSIRRQPEKMIAAFERAVELNPSDANSYCYLGLFLAQAGRPDEAIRQLDQAIRLSPRDPAMWFFQAGIAVAHFVAGRYEESAEWAQESLQGRPDYVYSHGILAASYALLGRDDASRTALAEALRVQPDVSLANLRLLLSSAAPDFAGRLIDGLRKAGLPEG
jgi:TolB-like protein/class 3 adenylate cyclase/cytochrome c-type biogenesis protein CcmH/NrfG